MRTRKTVTIVFTDVVGSTTLGEGRDPEVLRQVMTTTSTACGRSSSGMAAPWRSTSGMPSWPYSGSPKSTRTTPCGPHGRPTRCLPPLRRTQPPGADQTRERTDDDRAVAASQYRTGRPRTDRATRTRTPMRDPSSPPAVETTRPLARMTSGLVDRGEESRATSGSDGSSISRSGRASSRSLLWPFKLSRRWSLRLRDPSDPGPEPVAPAGRDMHRSRRPEQQGRRRAVRSESAPRLRESARRRSMCPTPNA
jgi:hypothetical protein